MPERRRLGDGRWPARFRINRSSVTEVNAATVWLCCRCCHGSYACRQRGRGPCDAAADLPTVPNRMIRDATTACERPADRRAVSKCRVRLHHVRRRGRVVLLPRRVSASRLQKVRGWQASEPQPLGPPGWRQLAAQCTTCLSIGHSRPLPPSLSSSCLAHYAGPGVC